MYQPWFEMMLRLKANYFWPASKSFALSSSSVLKDSVRKYV
jgi:hypothetical protein